MKEMEFPTDTEDMLQWMSDRLDSVCNDAEQEAGSPSVRLPCLVCKIHSGPYPELCRELATMIDDSVTAPKRNTKSRLDELKTKFNTAMGWDERCGIRNEAVETNEPVATTQQKKGTRMKKSENNGSKNKMVESMDKNQGNVPKNQGKNTPKNQGKNTPKKQAVGKRQKKGKK